MEGNVTFDSDYLNSAQLPETFQSMDACFTAFDQDGDGYLKKAEFTDLCKTLFRDDRNKPYELEGEIVNQLFDIFDNNQDGLIDDKEFELCWQNWIKKIVQPVSALIVVDVQNDFISGSLAMSKYGTAGHNGEDVIEPINKLLDTVEFDSVFYVRDWHPDDHLSFLDNISKRKLDKTSPIQDPEQAVLFDTVVFKGPPLIEQKLWPRHCVQDSWGSQLHENLQILNGSSFIFKGTKPEIDSYSAFFDNGKLSKTILHDELTKRGVTDVYTCGLAYETCVGLTAFHAVELGYRTTMVDDAARGLVLEDIEKTKTGLIEQDALVVQSDEVKSMVQGKDRRLALGIKLATEIEKHLKTEEKADEITE